MITVLYRKSSGEVIKIAPKGQDFSGRNPEYWGMLTDPEIEGLPDALATLQAAQKDFDAVIKARELMILDSGVTEKTPDEEAALSIKRDEVIALRQAYKQQQTRSAQFAYEQAEKAFKLEYQNTNARINADIENLFTPEQIQQFLAANTAVESALDAVQGIVTARWKADVPNNRLVPIDEAETDALRAAEEDDDAKQGAEQVRKMFENHPHFRRFAALVFKMINRTREDAGLQPWAKQQIVNYIRNNVSKDD